MENAMRDKIREAARFLEQRITTSPRIGMITGTGLGEITSRMDVDVRIPYREIPNFPESTIEGHRGTLVFGNIGGHPVAAQEGRFHLYEGYTPREITFPVRVMALLGVEYLLISSAAGGLNPGFRAGDLMVVTDHINLTGQNPLTGPNLDDFGPRFPDMSRVYDPELISLAVSAGGPSLRKGVYAGLSGPSLETPAETRFLRIIGADAVGMSTVLEVIVGVHCGMRVMAIVVITNVNIPGRMAPVSLEDVLAAARESGPALSALWERILSDLPASAAVSC